MGVNLGLRPVCRGLCACRTIPRRLVNAIAAVRGRIDPAQELERAGVRPITWHDTAYPRLLREIPDLPPVLFVKGELGPDDERLVTVVGTRRPAAYGREAARHLAGDLARARRDRGQRAGAGDRRRGAPGRAGIR